MLVAVSVAHAASTASATIPGAQPELGRRGAAGGRAVGQACWQLLGGPGGQDDSIVEQVLAWLQSPVESALLRTLEAK